MNDEQKLIAVSSVALARLEHRRATVSHVVNARGVTVHQLAPGLVGESIPHVDVHWRRLFYQGTPVLDCTKVDGYVRCHVFVPGPWLALLPHPEWAVVRAEASLPDHRGQPERRDETVGGGRPNPRPATPAQPRKEALVDLATVVAAGGERLEWDPHVRVRRIGSHSVAVGHAAGSLLLSVHTSDGMEVIAAEMDAGRPHRLRRSRGHRYLHAMMRIPTNAGPPTAEDRHAFAAFRAQVG